MDSSPRVHNVTFHGVGRPGRRLEPDEDRVWIDTDTLLASLDALRGRPDVRITFDDGNRSDVEVALPALLSRGMTATFFVLAGRLGESEYVDSDDVRHLKQSGMTIGSHGLYHVDWRTLDADALTRELVDSRAILEDLIGAPVTEASVPFGSYDRRVLAAARSRGRFLHLYTSDGGVARRGSWLQTRNTVSAEAPMAALAAPTRTDEVIRAAKRCVKRWR